MLLGTTASYGVLAGSTVTNTNDTVINGDLGLYPGTSVTGFPPGIVNGVTRVAPNAAAAQAKSDLVVAYDDAAGRGPGTVLASSEIGGLTLAPGVYTARRSSNSPGRSHSTARTTPTPSSSSESPRP
ncbi:ice-binding family protein [Streptomyces sp. NBC_00158]|uniref:ice-binding family protein n=1 Tax=Streptomyces sp. NBC_00158 TaxID=2903627 RepID=UPI00324523A4